MCETVPLEVRGVGQCLLAIKLESALSLVLDHEEIQLLDQDHPIGDGSYATVYRGKWRSLDVAIQFVKDQHKALLDFYKFEHEMVVLARLRHPCVTRLIGAVVAPGKLSLVIEFVQHGSLSDVLRAHAELPVLIKALIARDGARGLSFLHASGILHRDVKPENLLIASLSPHDEPLAKLADFGAARLLASDAARQAELTAAVGTPLYMAPEVLRVRVPRPAPPAQFAHARLFFGAARAVQRRGGLLQLRRDAVDYV